MSEYKKGIINVGTEQCPELMLRKDYDTAVAEQRAYVRKLNNAWLIDHVNWLKAGGWRPKKDPAMVAALAEMSERGL